LDEYANNKSNFNCYNIGKIIVALKTTATTIPSSSTTTTTIKIRTKIAKENTTDL
jgi:hypothetical protein